MASLSLSPDQLALVADRFRALGEPSRLLILQTLREGEHTVTELMEATGLGQANLSKHLQTLHGAGFVARRKEGVSAIYQLADDDVLKLCDLCCGHLQKETERRVRLFDRRTSR